MAAVPGLGVCDDGTFGAWTAPTFSSGDYTASGSMTWTVDSADAQVFYLILGKTMLISFRLGSTSVGGTLSNELRMTIPAGKTSNRIAAAPIWIAQAGPLFEAGFAQAAAGGTAIVLKRLNEGNWVASTNDTYVFGQLLIEIQ